MFVFGATSTVSTPPHFLRTQPAALSLCLFSNIFSTFNDIGYSAGASPSSDTLVVLAGIGRASNCDTEQSCRHLCTTHETNMLPVSTSVFCTVPSPRLLVLELTSFCSSTFWQSSSKHANAFLSFLYLQISRIMFIRRLLFEPLNDATASFTFSFTAIFPSLTWD